MLHEIMLPKATWCLVVVPLMLQLSTGTQAAHLSCLGEEGLPVPWYAMLLSCLPHRHLSGMDFILLSALYLLHELGSAHCLHACRWLALKAPGKDATGNTKYAYIDAHRYFCKKEQQVENLLSNSVQPRCNTMATA